MTTSKRASTRRAKYPQFADLSSTQRRAAVRVLRLMHEDVKIMHVKYLYDVTVRFQFIEHALKLYVKNAYDIVRIKTKGLVPFKHDEKALRYAPLSRLVNLFEQFVDDSTLVDDLRKLIDERNYCAHVAFMKGAMIWEDFGDLLDSMVRQRELHTRVHAVAERVTERMLATYKIRKSLERRTRPQAGPSDYAGSAQTREVKPNGRHR